MRKRKSFGEIIFAAVSVFFTVCRAASGIESAMLEEAFIDIRKIDPTIVIDLRYAGTNNLTGRPLYPPGMPALVRWSVAERLVIAQKYLRPSGYSLKIWDAYRPRSSQEQLWNATHNNSYVADPKDPIGSLHTRGVAVDATLVDAAGREVAMPTTFDNFTPAAMIDYRGADFEIRSNLRRLQHAMGHAGFYGLRTEWWHFCAADWSRYAPVAEIKLTSQGEHPGL